MERLAGVEPVEGTVDVEVDAARLWAAFARPDRWPRWNPSMFWAANRDLVLGDRLVWVFEPIHWWYPYKLPAIGTIVELEPGHLVTWEITAVPGFYARHSYWMDDLGGGRTRFGSTERATGPTFDAGRAFWLAHFAFVRDASLAGAKALEELDRRTGSLALEEMPPPSPRSTVAMLVTLGALAVAARALGGALRPADGRPRPG
jgi:hypothetical protein